MSEKELPKFITGDELKNLLDKCKDPNVVTMLGSDAIFSILYELRMLRNFMKSLHKMTDGYEVGSDNEGYQK